ncbi:MAG TPA: acyl-CoA dehydrogenase family protein, partial [Dehalococcoidia bacterium]
MTATHELAPAADAYLDGVRALLPGIRARAAQTERLGQLPEETVHELEEAGVFRGLQPRQWGGLELHPTAFFESIVLLGSACGSTGWVAGVLGVHPWEVALLADEAQREVWAHNPNARISSSYAPTGKVRRVEGGFLLSGSWHFSSGVDLCDWALLGGTAEGEGDAEDRAFLVRRADFAVDHGSWQVAGLAGTGSKSVRLEAAFVPEYRSHRLVDVNHGENPGWAVNDRPLYRLPWMTGVFAYAIAAPAIGAASGALECYVDQTRTRVGAFGGPPIATNPAVHRRLADALAAIETERIRLRVRWDEFYRIVSAGEAIPGESKLQCRYDAARAISTSLHAVL